jgi:hypothetical protein
MPAKDADFVLVLGWTAAVAMVFAELVQRGFWPW